MARLADPEEALRAETLLSEATWDTDRSLSALETLLVTALHDPVQLRQETVAACTQLLCTAALPDAVYDRALTLIAALLYVRPDLLYDAALTALATVLVRPGLADSTYRAACRVLDLLVTSTACPSATAVLLQHLLQPSLSSVVYDCLMESLHHAVCWAISCFALSDMLTLAECDHLQRYRIALLAGPIERCLFADPTAVTLPLLSRLQRVYGAEPSLRYCLYYLSHLGMVPNHQMPQASPRSTVPITVRDAAAGAVPGRFPLHATVAGLLTRGPQRVLMVQNIADAQGDEIVRCVPLLEALLACNPALTVVLVTARAYLYAHPRLTVIAFADRARRERLPCASFHGIIDFCEPDFPELNHALDLEERLQEVLQTRKPALFVAARKGFNTFVYHTVDVFSQSYAQQLGLDQQRVKNVYEATFRLIAELGLPLRTGEMPPGEATPLSALPCPEAIAAWSALLEGNVGGRPVALVNGFGGANRLKGFVEQTFSLCALEARALLPAGYFVVLLPNGTPWGSASIAQRVRALLLPTEQALVAIGPDPAESTGLVTFATPGALSLPYASAVMRLLTYFIRFADYIVTVEGWMAHAAGILGKRYKLLTPPDAHPGEWPPYGRTRHQDVGHDYLALAPASRRITNTSPPLPGRPEKHALQYVLSRLGSYNDSRFVPVLRQILRSEDRTLRQVAAEALSRYPLPDVQTDLQLLLEDCYHGVRAAAARGLLAQGKSASAGSALSRAELLAYQCMGDTPPDWPQVFSLADAARPALQRALQDDDPVMRREAAAVLRHLDGAGQLVTLRPAAGRIDQSPERPASTSLIAPLSWLWRLTQQQRTPLAMRQTPSGDYQAYQERQDAAMKAIPRFPSGRFAGAGIVIVAGGPRYFTCAYVLVTILRRVLGCTLPIQVWHLGPEEMSAELIALLRPFAVVCVDAYEMRDRSPALPLHRFAAKPYAILHSPFKDVILLDADNLPLRDPALLLSLSQFRQTGALFWPDIGSIGREAAIWEICRIPYRHEPAFESGQIVVDKERCWQALHLTWHLNEWSDFYYQHLQGDKDTFHIAWRMLDQPYGMPPFPPTQIWGLRSANDPDPACLLEQHDFQGEALFHHRTGGAKWIAWGRNLWLAQAPLNDACQAALMDLRQRWTGWVTPPPPPAMLVACLDEDIVRCRRFLYRRIGAEQCVLELLPDHSIVGGSMCEQHWRIDDGGGLRALALEGRFGVICTLIPGSDGVWRGVWRAFEQMPVELIPLGPYTAGPAS